MITTLIKEEVEVEPEISDIEVGALMKIKKMTQIIIITKDMIKFEAKSKIVDMVEDHMIIKIQINLITYNYNNCGHYNYKYLKNPSTQDHINDVGKEKKNTYEIFYGYVIEQKKYLIVYGI